MYADIHRHSAIHPHGRAGVDVLVRRKALAQRKTSALVTWTGLGNEWLSCCVPVRLECTASACSRAAIGQKNLVRQAGTCSLRLARESIQAESTVRARHAADGRIPDESPA